MKMFQEKCPQIKKICSERKSIGVSLLPILLVFKDGFVQIFGSQDRVGQFLDLTPPVRSCQLRAATTCLGKLSRCVQKFAIFNPSGLIKFLLRGFEKTSGQSLSQQRVRRKLNLGWVPG